MPRVWTAGRRALRKCHKLRIRWIFLDVYLHLAQESYDRFCESAFESETTESWDA